MKMPSIIRNWDESQRASAVKIFGLCVAALALFILIATISYLLHWKQDMSFVPGEAVANAAGTLGYRTGKFLVCDFLGLGSFALLVILVAIAVRLLTGKLGVSLVKTVLLAVSGAFVASLLLAFIGKLAGLENAFGGGLGGACGAAVVDAGVLVLGPFVTAIVILLLVALWLFFTSSRFNQWLAGLWSRKENPEPDNPEAEKEEEPRRGIWRKPKPVIVPGEPDEPEIQEIPEKPDYPEVPDLPAHTVLTI